MDYDTHSLGAGISRAMESFAQAQEETKNRAREFKALQEYADATGYADKNTTTTMDLDALKGLVRGSEAKRIQSEHEERLGFERRRVNLAELARTDAENQWAAGAPGRKAMVDYHNQLTQSSKAAEQSRMAGLAEQGRRQGREAAFNQELAGQTAGPGMRALADYANGDMLGGARPDLGALGGMNGQGFREQPITSQGVLGAAVRHGQALNPQVDNLMAVLAREQAAKGGAATSFEPTLATRKVTLEDGRVIEIPFGTTSHGGAHWMPDVVRPRTDALSNEPPPDPVISPDGKLIWDAKNRTWKQLRRTQADELRDLLNPPAGGGATNRPPAAAKAPDFKFNPKTGKLE